MDEVVTGPGAGDVARARPGVSEEARTSPRWYLLWELCAGRSFSRVSGIELQSISSAASRLRSSFRGAKLDPSATSRNGKRFSFTGRSIGRARLNPSGSSGFGKNPQVSTAGNAGKARNRVRVSPTVPRDGRAFGPLRGNHLLRCDSHVTDRPRGPAGGCGRTLDLGGAPASGQPCCRSSSTAASLSEATKGWWGFNLATVSKSSIAPEYSPSATRALPRSW